MSDPQRTAQQVLVTNFGLTPSGYTGSQGVVGYTGSAGSSGTNGYTGSAGPAGIGTSARPKVTAIAYSGNDTAADTAGGQTITLIGTGFATGATVIINGVQASVVSVVNSTTITFTASALAAGGYVIYVVNTDGGTAVAVPGIQYSGTPAWATGSGSLGSPGTQTSFTANVVATGDAPVTYSVYSGSLPAGLTLTANTGVISGTTPNVAVDTTYNFTIRATDAQQQDTDRAFSITITANTITPSVEYLVVAGGGGGGGGGGFAGGGAGGLLTGNLSVTGSVPYTVTVGAGGIGGVGPDYTFRGVTNGYNSVFSSITTIGGGAGGMYGNGTQADAIGKNGGSGGGGAYTYPYTSGEVGGTGTAGPPRQGYNGGTGAVWSGGGGGGAGANGSPGTGSHGSATGGNGGIGVQSSITGTATYYAGGGGAGTYSGASVTVGTGGQGGGGTGSHDNAVGGTAGTANTGGGGGGGGYNSGISGNGGSGIVIVRHPDSYIAAASTTGSPTITVTGGYRIYRWTSSGSITF